ncbi:MAG: amidohydrolase [Bacteroidia bacterium]|nr:amidohydrolase [Bacteroidia bacterium]MCX7652497.1 amidohydrolase [Bacteroidia bacterium]MDW8416680.1 amidohydrolase [Bacteroidia bacterium]
MPVLHAAERLFPRLLHWRRHLHRHPEPSFAEWETQAFILEELRLLPELRIRKAAQTGVIADLVTDPQGAWIALRADIDALPIEEKRERPYRSQRPGYMHACGHDAHTAILLGTLYLLWENRSLWRGGIRFIFQPGEEKSPGGASLLIQEGVLEDVPIQAIWGLHVTPQLSVGQVGLRAGPFMAASDEIHIRLRGSGGHAAYPHLTSDPIAVGAYLVTQLQMIVSRAADPRSPTVLTFGRFHGGSAPNIIPVQVELSGTLRTFDESWRLRSKSLLVEIVRQTAGSWGLEADIEFLPGYPVLHNDHDLTIWTRRRLSELLGETHVLEMPLWLSSEDFAFYSQQKPACFIRLGTAGEDPDTRRPVHTPEFDIDERALVIGVAVLSHLAISFLGGKA